MELLAILVFYVVYSAIRNIHGGAAAPPHAFDHARQIMSLEHHLGIYHEQTIQQWALHFRPLILFANYYYGSFHFVVTIFAGIFLYRHFSDDYPRFRNTLAITTGLALIGFTLYPLAPPRMFPGFVDTLLKDPGVLVVQLRRYADRCRISTRRCRASTSRGPRGARSHSGRA